MSNPKNHEELDLPQDLSSSKTPRKIEAEPKLILGEVDEKSDDLDTFLPPQ